ncbi:restriction endonuclease subunit S [Pseudomonas aeruginosa]|uniref:restriction endonuclease subunit S n=1 Tax=Pseudomonas aeruginosa TaxID=287 RepID=UPI00345B3D5E
MSHYKPYPAYKDSGVEWLGKVPEHWQVMAIKHIVSTPITDGPHETPEFLDDGVPFVSAEAVSAGKVDFEKIRGFISREDHERYSQKYCPQRGDIFMIKSGATTGVTAIVDTDEEFNIWSPLAVIRCGGRSAPYFVLNFMRSRSFQEAVTLSWSYGTQQNIGMGVIGNLAVTVPPQEEQQVIAAHLDRETARIDALIEKKTRFIEVLREKREALITHAVTKGLDPNVKMKDSGVEWLGEVPEHWAVCKLSFRYSVELGKMLDEKRITSTSLMAYLRNQDVQWDAVNAEDLPVMDIYPEELSRYTVRAGDLLVCEGGGVGRAAIWRGENDVIGYQKALHRLRPRNDATDTAEFFFFALMAAKAKGVFEESDSKATIAHLPAEKFRQYRFAFPPAHEQREIAGHIRTHTQRLDKVLITTERSIELLKERRSALITAAVTGQIDLREAV